MVSGFKHDLFISYAWADNREQLPGEQHSRWVFTLKEALAQRLADRLRPTAVSVWLDKKDMEGNLPLDDVLQSGATTSALFLLVLSKNYLVSKYCLQELDEFIKAAGGAEQSRGRIFVVAREETSLGERPEAIRSLTGYDFYCKNRVTEKIETYGDPTPASRYPAEYSDAVNNLVSAIEKQLKTMGGSPEAKARPKRGDILLAAGTPDLERLNRQLRKHLEDADYRVLLDERLQHAPPGYEQKFDDAARQSLLFVQILGAFHEPPLPPAYPQGFERWQFERARQAGCEILQWRRRELDTAELAEDPAHRDFVLAPPVIACDFEEFKQIVIERAAAVANRRERPEGKPKVLLLHTRSVDDALAREIGQRVEDLCGEQQLGTVFADVVPEGLSLEKVAEANPDFHGLVVVYGQADQPWIESQTDACRRLALKYQRKKPVCGLFLGPPTPKPQLKLPARLEPLPYDDEQRLRAFLTKLAGWTP